MAYPKTFPTKEEALKHIEQNPDAGFSVKRTEKGYKVSPGMPKIPTTGLPAGKRTKRPIGRVKLPRVKLSRGGTLRGKGFSGIY